MEFELKKWDFSYIDDVEKYANNKSIIQNLCEPIPFPLLHTHARYYVEQRVLNNEKKQICRAIVADGHAIGSIDLFIGDGIHSKSAELSLWVAVEYQNKGIGTAAIKELCDFAFKNYDIARIFSEPYTDDLISAKILEKAGFNFEGTLKKFIYKNDMFYDCNVYALVK